jgi:aminopeptidase N
MPVRIGIVTGGKRTLETIWLKNKEEVFEIASPQRPLMVRFDEGDILLKELTFDKNVDELLYQIKHDDVTGRTWAAAELGKFKDDPRAIEGLTESAMQDSFWAVRRAATETLGQLQKQEHIDFLKEKSSDKNSKVRASALAALGNYKNSELVEFFKERFEQDDSYVVQAEALRAIGKSGTASSGIFLEQAAKTRSPRNVIETAARWALQELSK